MLDLDAKGEEETMQDPGTSPQGPEILVGGCPSARAQSELV